MPYLVHASTHVLVCLTHGDLLAERANCKVIPNISVSALTPTGRKQFDTEWEEDATKCTFLLLLGLFAAASFQLLLRNPLLCHLGGVGSAQSGHQPRVKEL